MSELNTLTRSVTGFDASSPSNTPPKCRATNELRRDVIARRYKTPNAAAAAKLAQAREGEEQGEEEEEEGEEEEARETELAADGDTWLLLPVVVRWRAFGRVSERESVSESV